MRRARTALIAMAACLLAVAGAARAGPFVVVEAGTGAVLVTHRAVDPWYPASLTKLMTIYVALDAVRAGELTPLSPVTMSPAALAVRPNSAGLDRGDVLMLDAALRILVVRSANDLAVAVAEAVSGTEAAFVARMNATAERLGLSGTHFENPHGLHDLRHVSTARDMAVLAGTIIAEFPGWRGLFGLSALTLGNDRMENHNLLLGRYAGADGMKTGFVCASGYNIAASATRDGRTILTVLLGAASETERLEDAARLLEAGFARTALGGAVDLGALVALSPPAPAPLDMSPIVCGTQPASPNTAVPGANRPPPLAAIAGSRTVQSISLGAGVPLPRPPYGTPAPLPVPRPAVAADLRGAAAG